MSDPHVSSDSARWMRRLNDDRLLRNHWDYTIEMRAARASSEAKGFTGLPLRKFVIMLMCERSKFRGEHVDRYGRTMCEVRE